VKERRDLSTLRVVAERIGARWYGVLYRRSAAPQAMTVDEVANRVWVTAACGDEATALRLAEEERERRGRVSHRSARD
jgi:hypothetical protein